MSSATPLLGTPSSRRGFGRLLAGAGVAALGGFPVAMAQAPIRFALDWRFEGPAALFLTALDKGYFREEGLDVTIEPGGGSREAIQRVATGGYDAAFGDVTSLIRFRDEHPAIDLKAVMIVYDRPPFAIVGRKSRGITADPKSLEGKKLGAPATDAAFAQWPIFRKLNGIDDGKIKLETIGFPVREPMLASGEVDAIFGFAQSAAITLKARGVPMDDIVTLVMADYGVELYGNAVIASPRLISERPEAVRGLLRALARSVRDVVADPEAALASVLKRNDGARPEIELERLKMVTEQFVSTPQVRANGFGGIDRARWERALDQIAGTVPLKDRARAGNAFTGAFLPAEAERGF
ncbi:ABC transporter substrate-binding protein [Bosea sp. CS1GBMeth4]|uniref:ABC transporter substrate-binding protein n=1 Tax=Bosea sp. CS1GBMeth4 TaxID=1892849 RepID=UPI00164688D7|nr:ABC transporter substrate-binding protein [Bosea sp. CS1GBMeth4]